MFGRQFVSRLLIAALLVFTLGHVDTFAQSQVIKVDHFKIDGYLCDFGTGTHLAFHPTGDASLTWSFATVNGQLAKTARVQGTLYVDTISAGGCANITIKFQNGSTALATRILHTQCPSPGGDANLSANQLQVDESFTSTELISVFVQTDSINPTSSLFVSTAPSLQRSNVNINNGNTDFGTGLHAAGTPTGSGVVMLTVSSGSVSALVNGTLYWDSLFSGGCAQLIIDFENAAGTNLSTKTIKKCGTGGNANDAGNHTDVNQTFVSGSMMQVRLRVGTVMGDGSFQSVKKKLCDFKNCRDI